MRVPFAAKATGICVLEDESQIQVDVLGKVVSGACRGFWPHIDSWLRLYFLLF